MKIHVVTRPDEFSFGQNNRLCVEEINDLVPLHAPGARNRLTFQGVRTCVRRGGRIFAARDSHVLVGVSIFEKVQLRKFCLINTSIRDGVDPCMVVSGLTAHFTEHFAMLGEPVALDLTKMRRGDCFRQLEFDLD